MAKKVLVIDDDANVVRFVTVALEQNGYEAASAADGVEGFEMVQSERPDMLILDVMMPKRTGFVLFKQLRKTEEFKDLPVLMLTGVADVLNEQDAMAENTEESPFDALRESLRKTIRQMRDEGLVKPDMFMDKPIDPEVLMAKVKDLIGT